MSRWNIHEFCFGNMLLTLHQDKTFCKSCVKGRTGPSLEWLTVPMEVSSANMSALVSVNERVDNVTYINNRIGPSTKPWGTPVTTSLLSEITPE